MKIVNNTDLSYEVIGKMIDQITKDCLGDTLYYGKIDNYRFVHGKKGYSLTIRYLKRYVEWRFYENN